MTQAHSISGRPRSFDEHAVLTQVMQTFWRHGFNATNYDQIEDATGLRRQSLIYAFGNKQAMFEKALAHYIDGKLSDIAALLERERPLKDRISDVFNSWLADAGSESRQGCLVVNTAGELGVRHPDIARHLTRSNDRLATLFEHAFEKAIASGELTTNLSAHALAELATAVGDGGLLHARADGHLDRTRTAYAAFLTLLG